MSQATTLKTGRLFFMADLYQILGAMMRDIAKARMSSDIYSKDIARFYEQDSLLRRFPLPRTDITELDLTLRFAIGKVDFDVSGEAAIMSTFAEPMQTLADQIASSAIAVAIKNRNETEDAATRSWLVKIQSEPARINIRRSILESFTQNWSHLIGSTGSLDLPQATQLLGNALRGSLAQEMAWEPDPAARQINGGMEKLAAAVTAATDFKTPLDTLQQAITQMWDRRGGCTVEVNISADTIKSLAAETLSSVNVKFTVRNYTWTQFLSDSGDARFQLNSE
jgi:hypothetical protein